MMSSVTDRPYCGKSIYRRLRAFISRALCVLLANFVTHNTKPCFMTFHDISSETLSECSVDVFLLFAQDCKQHSHSSEARLAAGFHSVQRWEEGRRLNYMLVWIPWNGLLITPEQAWLKFIGGAETHNGRRGNKLLTRTFKTLHKLYISINWRPALLIHQPPTQRTVWHCELCTYGSVYCIFTVVCARTGGCM